MAGSHQETIHPVGSPFGSPFGFPFAFFVSSLGEMTNTMFHKLMLLLQRDLRGQASWRGKLARSASNFDEWSQAQLGPPVERLE